jgi:hypothetical protein
MTARVTPPGSGFSCEHAAQRLWPSHCSIDRELAEWKESKNQDVESHLSFLITMMGRLQPRADDPELLVGSHAPTLPSVAPSPSTRLDNAQMIAQMGSWAERTSSTRAATA